MKTGLVLEGGGVRGVFTAAVLEVFKENGICFDYGNGTSAGAVMLSNFIEGNTKRINTILMSDGDSSYIGIKELLKTGNYMNLQKLYDVILNDSPAFDYDSYFYNKMEREYVATCCETGKPEYFTDDFTKEHFKDVGCASCSLPILSKPYTINGRNYMDGSISDPLPIDRAFYKGCDKLIVISTKGPGMEPSDLAKYLWFMKLIYPSSFKPFFEAIRTRIKRVEDAYEYLEALEKEGRIMVIHPQSVAISHLEKDTDKVRLLYKEGYQYATENLGKIKQFLEIVG